MKPSPDANENISPFEKLLAALAAGGVDFAVAGGVAVILNGYPRLTLDVDILVGQGDENIRKLLNCLAQWGEGWARELKVEDFSPQPGAIRVTEEFDLDIFTQMDGKPLDYFRPRLRHMRTGLVTIPYLAPEDLVHLKQHSWREKDKLDAAAMKEVIDRENKARRH